MYSLQFDGSDLPFKLSWSFSEKNIYLNHKTFKNLRDSLFAF